MPDAAHISALADAVVAWFRRGHRDLPWRRTRDPYSVWVSEIMLQQTRVDTVAPRWQRWMARFPTVSSLAAAPLDDVLAEWAGLGYYARARNLHAAARQVEERYGGRVPDEPEAISSLPGIGRYTAGAILSIAFGRAAPILDGNVERVLARLFRIGGDPKAAPAKQELWSLATRFVESAGSTGSAALHNNYSAMQHDDAALHSEAAGASLRVSHVNQGLMELGAVVCTPRRPLCLACPLSTLCEARRHGDAESFPAASRPTRVLDVDHVCVALFRGAKLLLVRRPPEGLFGGLFELPAVEPAPGEALGDAAARVARERVGLDAVDLRPLPAPHHRHRQLLSHRRITFHAFRAEAPHGRVARQGYDAHRWLTVDEALAQGDLGIARATSRLLAGLGKIERDEATLRDPPPAASNSPSRSRLRPRVNQ